MNRDVGLLVRTVLALVLLAFVVLETLGALRASGAWGGHARGARTPAVAAPADPVAPVEAILATVEPALSATFRDPFQIGARPAPVAVTGPAVRRPVVAPAKPVLTAIVWDADPRALVRWKGRDWTVRPGALFDVFQVTGITRNQVTLTRGTETLVLQRKAQGD